MSAGLIKVFEMVSGWTELNHFQDTHYGHITHENIHNGGDAYFLWRPDEEPVKLEHMTMDGTTFVRFGNNEDCHARN